jgi:hypothetical protein
MEAAMDFLAESDESYAEAKTDMLRCEIVAKRSRARIFMTGDGSVEARKAAAEGHPEVIDSDDSLIDATLVYERLRAKRQRAELVIDVFRTLEASRRKS